MATFKYDSCTKTQHSGADTGGEDGVYLDSGKMKVTFNVGVVFHMSVSNLMIDDKTLTSQGQTTEDNPNISNDSEVK